MNYDTKAFMHPETRKETQHQNVHPQFFELTAEEQQEQEFIRVREMSIFVPIDATRAREIIAEQNRIKEKEMSIIDPTDEQRGKWNLTAGIENIPTERGFWQTAADTVIESIDSYIDKIPNANRLTKKQRDIMQAYIFLTGTQTFDHEVQTHDPVIELLNKRAKKFSDFEFGSAKDLITSLVLAECGKVATAKQLKDYEWDEQKSRSRQTKADYKAKFYKNTAKQPKPSPMLMSLIGKTK